MTQVKKLELSLELVQTGIKEIFCDNERIEINFTDKEGKDDTIHLPVKKYAYQTVQQLDGLVNGSMTTEQFTQLQYYLSLELPKIWTEVYSDEKEDSRKQESQIKIAFETVKQEARKLFTDEYQTPYVALTIDGHLQIFRIDSNAFKDWYRLFIYEKNGTILDNETINKLCSIARAYAASSKYGEQIKLNLRTASRIVNGKQEWIYDLTNKNWEFVTITSNGWYISKDDIIFRRYNNQQGQVYPSREYDKNILDRFIGLLNVQDKDSKLLLKVYIISLFIPDIQKTILMLHGAHGAAKSSLEELIKILVDPAAAKTFSIPRNPKEMIQQLSHNHIACYDNVSKLSPWVSDLFCRAVTGSGSSDRQLFTDDEDIIRSFKRAILFNGINLAATKADVLDRGLIILLEEILPENRRLPQEIWKEFEDMKPQLLGYILDKLVEVLKWDNDGPELKLPELPRMAEFAKYGEMIARCLGYEEKEFIDAFNGSSLFEAEEIIESSDVGRCLKYMMFEKYQDKYTIGETYKDERDIKWEATATELIDELNTIARAKESLHVDIDSKYWPSIGTVLSKRLREIEPTLRKIGIIVERSHGNKRLISIRKLLSAPSAPSNTEIHEGKDTKDEDTIPSVDKKLPSTEDKTPSVDNSKNTLKTPSYDDTDDNDDELHTSIGDGEELQLQATN